MKPKNIGTKLFANWPAKIISLTVAVVIFFMYRIDTQQQFSVPLDKKLPAGFAIANEYPKRIEVILRGMKYRTPIEESNFYAFFDLSDIKTEGMVQAKIEVKFLGEELKPGTFEFEYQPSTVSLDLEKEIDKKVTVVPNIVGNPPKGFKFEYQVVPSEVTIRGPRSHVEKISKVTTEKIDLSSQITEMRSFVKIYTGSSYVRPVENKEVLLQILISQEQADKRFPNVEIVLINTPISLQVLSDLPRGSIELRGNQVDLDALKPEQLKFVINCNEVTEPGEYVFIPEPSIPAKMTVINYEPRTILIKFGIRRREP